MSAVIVYGVISAITAAYSAYQQSEAQQAAADQSEYDAEFEAEQARQAAEQERMNRESARKQQARISEEDKRRRVSMLTAAGGGIGMSAMQELSRQASIDEINIQNADLQSVQRRKALGLSATNALLAGRSRASSYRAAGRASMIGGIGKAVGSGVGAYAKYKKG